MVSIMLEMSVLVVFPILLNSVTSFLPAQNPTEPPLFNYEICKADSSNILKDWEEWPNTNVQLCAENVPYNHEIIETALKKDKKLYSLYTDLVRSFYPLPYENPLEFNETESFACRDICPGKYRNATAVIYTTEVARGNEVSKVSYTCNIVRPWEQVIPFMTCASDIPDIHLELSENHYYCVPNSFVQREIVVFCPEAYDQCKSVKMMVPLGCTAASIKCKGSKVRPKVSEKVENEFLSFLSGFF